MNSQPSYTASHVSDYSTERPADDSSFRGRKENVNIQIPQRSKRSVLEPPVKRHLPVNNGVAGHKRKSSFLAQSRPPQCPQRQPPAGKQLRLSQADALREQQSEPIIRPGSAITTDVERQGENAMRDYGREVEAYQRGLEQCHLAPECLQAHEITPILRAKMVDWMVEVLTNFHCNDQTFFLAVALMDRYLKLKKERRPIADLHVIGVTAMFLASKYEDILPLRMDTVEEKIAHKKLTAEAILDYEHDLLVTIEYFIQTPTALEFLRRYCRELGLGPEDRTLIERMSMYLSKMSLHDYFFCGVRPSRVAVSSIYVALKICEQLRKRPVLSKELVEQMATISGYKEEEIVGTAQLILTNAQNFDTLFPGLTNLKRTHFSSLME